MSKGYRKSLVFLILCITAAVITHFYIRNTFYLNRQSDSKSWLLLTLSKGMQLKQFITVVALFVFGDIVLLNVAKAADRILIAILAFPFALACWCVCSLMILILGLPYNLYTMLVIAIVTLVLSFLIRKKTDALGYAFSDITYFNYFIGIAAVVSCGFLFTSALSDVFYYNYLYGKELAILGKLDGELCLLPLTRGGQMSPLVSSLAYFCGFDNINMLNHMSMISMTGLCMWCVYDYWKDKRGIILFAVVLFSMTPYILMCGMVSNNTMEMFSITMLLMCLYQGREDNRDYFLWNMLAVLFSVMVTMGRIEGGIYLTFIALLIPMISWSGRRAVLAVNLPALLIASIYYLKLFVVMEINFDPEFISLKNVIFNLGVILLGSVYTVLIDCRIFEKIKDRIGAVLLAALVCLNFAELFLNHSKYLYNLKTILGNIVYRDKDWAFCVWGVVPWMLLIGVAFVIINKNLNYFSCIWIGFVLLVISVCMFRNPLRSGFGDSANRLLMMLLPVFAVDFVLQIRTVVHKRRDTV